MWLKEERTRLERLDEGISDAACRPQHFTTTSNSSVSRRQPTSWLNSKIAFSSLHNIAKARFEIGALKFAATTQTAPSEKPTRQHIEQRRLHKLHYQTQWRRSWSQTRSSVKILFCRSGSPTWPSVASPGHLHLNVLPHQRRRRLIKTLPRFLLPTPPFERVQSTLARSPRTSQSSLLSPRASRR